MSMEVGQLPDFGQKVLLRVPHATFASLMLFVKTLRREDLKGTLVCPPNIDIRTWAQVQTSLTLLGLVRDGEGTFLLRRLMTGETSLLRVIEMQIGTDVVEAVERGESCAVGSLADVQRVRSKSSIFRFESLVRMALKEQGRSPVRRRPVADRLESADETVNNETPSAKAAELALFELEGGHLASALGVQLVENNLAAAHEIREMLRDLHNQMGRL
ncbi:MAG TPA: hypothetical protein VMU98_06115 [Acidimicrobiales bacterium]|nr:hypothetical protein [Acidimicrobiales bacterium]